MATVTLAVAGSTAPDAPGRHPAARTLPQTTPTGPPGTNGTTIDLPAS
jgi:hypothetical protein